MRTGRRNIFLRRKNVFLRRKNVFLRRYEMVEQAKISNISVSFPAFNDGVNVYM